MIRMSYEEKPNKRLDELLKHVTVFGNWKEYCKAREEINVMLNAFDIISKLIMTDSAKVASNIFLRELLDDVRVNVKLACKETNLEG